MQVTGQSKRSIYYGWVLVWTLAFTELTSWGVLYYTFSVLIGPIQAETGWSRDDLSGAFSVGRLVSGIAALLVGRWLDRVGTRPIMTAGSTLAVLFVVAWSQVQTINGLYVVWIGIGIAMAMVLYEPAFAAVAVWFSRKRAHALTILTFGGGLASVIYVPLAGSLVRGYGWRSALLILAAMLAALTLPWHAVLLRHRPSDLQLNPDGDVSPPSGDFSDKDGSDLSRIVQTGKFWLLASAFVLVGFVSSGLIFHLIPYLTDNSYSAVFATNVVGLIGATALPGRLIFTPLGARVNRKWISAGLFAMLMISIPVLLIARSELGVIAFVLVFGVGYGAISPARAGLTADLFGTERYGAVSGMLSFLANLATAAAPFVISLVHTQMGSYAPVFLALIVLSGFATLLTLNL